MWKLKHNIKDHMESYLFVGEDFVVGRKDASILVEKDPSLSRRHAVLRVKHPEENLSDPSKKSSLFLRDEGSKYGTFKNGARLAPLTEVQLAHNDVVKFGQYDSEYKICQTPLVVTTSCLEDSAKKDLQKAIHKLGGHLISKWQSSCSHLTMTEVKVTIKALCCLLSAKPIVKPEYFQDLSNSPKTLSTFIHPNQYVPPSAEDLIDVSFDVNLQRKTLFQNKTFFFLDQKQFKKLLSAITLGGGNATILTSENLDPDELLQEGCCVIDPLKESQAFLEDYDILPAVMATLRKKKLRLIPETEIVYSVAHCSTETFCNPQFKKGEVDQYRKIVSQTLTQREIYVPDTEENAPKRMQKPKNITPAAACSSLHLSSFQIGTPVAEAMDISEVHLSDQMKRELDNIFAEPEDVQSKNDVPPNAEIVVPTLPVRMSRSQKRSVIQKKEPSTPEEILPKSEIIVPPSPVNMSKRQKRSVIQFKESPTADEVLPKSEVLAPTSPVRMSKRQKRSVIQFKESPSADVHSPEVHNNVAKVEEFESIRRLSPEEKPPDVKPPSTIKTNGFIHLEEDLPTNLIKIQFASLVVKKPVPTVQRNTNSSVKNFKKFRKVLPKKTQVLPRIIGAHELIAYDRAAAEILNEVWDDPVEEATLPAKGEFDW